jgi:hypothetical protein
MALMARVFEERTADSARCSPKSTGGKIQFEMQLEEVVHDTCRMGHPCLSLGRLEEKLPCVCGTAWAG